MYRRMLAAACVVVALATAGVVLAQPAPKNCLDPFGDTANDRYCVYMPLTQRLDEPPTPTATRVPPTTTPGLVTFGLYTVDYDDLPGGASEWETNRVINGDTFYSRTSYRTNATGTLQFIDEGFNRAPDATEARVRADNYVLSYRLDGYAIISASRVGSYSVTLRKTRRAGTVNYVSYVVVAQVRRDVIELEVEGYSPALEVTEATRIARILAANLDAAPQLAQAPPSCASSLTRCAYVPLAVNGLPTLPPSATPTSSPTVTLTPSATVEPTVTLTPSATRTSLPPTATNPPQQNFDNNGDGRVTCADFSTRSEALEALLAGYGNLDNDNDGIPCESLPAR